MAHYAYLNSNNIVTNVIVGKEEGEDGVNWEEYYGAKRTSYNTQGGIHLNGGVPFRKNYAGLGFTYDPVRDAFIPPKPHNTWILNENTCLWEPPIPRPQDGKNYRWNQQSMQWEVFTFGN